MLVPTFNFFAIPTPPNTVNAPFALFALSARSVYATWSDATNLPPIFKLPLIPAPPATINAPVVISVLFVTPDTRKSLFANMPPSVTRL